MISEPYPRPLARLWVDLAHLAPGREHAGQTLLALTLARPTIRIGDLAVITGRQPLDGVCSTPAAARGLGLR